LSATAGDLASVYRSQFPKAESVAEDDLEDFLGELTNRIGGQVKCCVASDAGECHMGLPHFIRGAGATFRYKAGTPALGLELTSGPLKFQMELCLHRFDHGTIRFAEGPAAMAPGVVTFL
jgi:hypothetical protein